MRCKILLNLPMKRQGVVSCRRKIYPSGIANVGETIRILLMLYKNRTIRIIPQHIVIIGFVSLVRGDILGPDFFRSENIQALFPEIIIPDVGYKRAL